MKYKTAHWKDAGVFCISYGNEKEVGIKHVWAQAMLAVDGRDEERFKSWLMDECKVRSQEANRIYDALAKTADVICAFG